MPTTNFIWDELSDNVLLETDETDALTAHYTNRPEQFGKLISQYRIEDEKVVESYYHYDGENSTRDLSDANENVTDTFTYTAYGEEVARTGTTTNPFGYKGAVGYYTNAETSDIYVRARTYEPALGCWLSADPLGFIDGPNLYRAYFVPNGIDPSGSNWTHSVDSGPDLDCIFGYTINIIQRIALGGGAIAGLQTWQTNDVNIIAVITNGQQCMLKEFELKLLDVNDVREGNANIRYRDKVSTKLGEVEGGNVCFVLEVTQKKLGFRTNNGVQFTEPKLPVGNGYQATNPQWVRAQKMSGPTLSATVRYVYYDSTCCVCTDDQKAQIKKLIQGVSGEEVDTGCCGFAMEYLKYGDLGTWLKYCS